MELFLLTLQFFIFPFFLYGGDEGILEALLNFDNAKLLSNFFFLMFIRKEWGSRLEEWKIDAIKMVEVGAGGVVGKFADWRFLE